MTVRVPALEETKTPTASTPGRAKSSYRTSPTVSQLGKTSRSKSAPARKRGDFTCKQTVASSPSSVVSRVKSKKGARPASPSKRAASPQWEIPETPRPAMELELVDLTMAEPDSASIEVSQLAFCSKEMDAAITVKFPLGNRLWPEGATATFTLHSDTKKHPANDQEEAIAKLWTDLGDSFPGSHRLCFWMIPGLAASYPRQFSFHAAAAARCFEASWKSTLPSGDQFRRTVYNSLQFYIMTYEDDKHSLINERHMHIINSLNNYRTHYPQKVNLKWLREQMYDVVCAKAVAWLQGKCTAEEATKRIKSLLPFDVFQYQVIGPTRRLQFTSQGYLVGDQLAPHDPMRKDLSRLPSSFAISKRRNNTPDGKVGFV